MLNRIFKNNRTLDTIPINDLSDIGELYHDYSLFGFTNRQLPGIFSPNQRCKEYIIRGYIQLAIAKCKIKMDDEVSFAELFCADGYYSMVARHLGATKAIGIDSNKDDFFTPARTIANRLGITNIDLIQEDVNNINKMDEMDIVANIGGLYHVSNPKEILIKSYEMAKKYLIVQTVVSLSNTDTDYFETPAPGWDWGSRYSKESFHKMITSLGYNIIDNHFNELEGNDRLEDRGSLYYLIKK